MTTPAPLTPQQLDEIARAVAATFGHDETPETRAARWEAAAHAAGREVDRNALRVYMAVADAEQQALADSWVRAMTATDDKVRRLTARVAELERPAVEAKRNEIRQSFTEIAAQAEQDGDYEAAANFRLRLREREEQWAAEDAAVPAP
jgi:hypothetical protein